MATLKTPLKHLDYIMDKMNHEKLYMVLHEDTHHIWVIKYGGGEPPFELAKRMVNLTYAKVDPKVARVLYAESAKVDEGVEGPAGVNGPDGVVIPSPSE